MTGREWLEKVGRGRRNAFRPQNVALMRGFRNAVAQANLSGKDCIINIDGSGYFRPNPLDEEDDRLFQKYMAEELHRARAILFKRKMMKRAYALWKYEAKKGA